jgi:hypothetical protein
LEILSDSVVEVENPTGGALFIEVPSRMNGDGLTIHSQTGIASLHSAVHHLLDDSFMLWNATGASILVNGYKGSAFSKEFLVEV